MHASADRLEFAPPPQPGLVRAFVLAVIAHLLLMIALTWGINWNRQTENLSAEAELWSAVPQEAAPALVQPPPPPPPPPAPEKKAEPIPPPPAPVVQDPNIALEREKKRQELIQRRDEELDKLKKLEARKKLEDKKRELLAAKKAAEDKKKQEEQAKAAKTKKQQLEEDKRLAAMRKENLDRMMKGLPGASGAPTAQGTAQRSGGPSPSYAGRVVARVRPNIVFTDDIAGNPTAEVEVRTAPDGTIVSRRILKSSGVASWDNAVLRALDKTEVLPRDVDGRVPTPMILEFRPRT
ncbi:MAG: TonB-like [Ramlibacter sp.]|nr:TonB-like [Ramlibacter sp.]